MYSIIDSCDETSSWRLPGLCNVKETALSFASLWRWRKFGVNEPCRVKHPQMSQGVSPHSGLHYRALPGEGVFHVRNVIGSIKAAGALPFSDFTSVQQGFRHCFPQASAAETGFNIQGSTAGFSLSSAKRNILLNHNQVLNTVCVRCRLSCVWLIFVVTNISPMGRKLETKVPVWHIICWIVTKLPPCSACLFWGQCLASWYLTCMSFSVWGNHRENPHEHEKNIKTLHIQKKGLWSIFKPTANHWITTSPSNIISTFLLRIVKEYSISTDFTPGNNCQLT